MRRLSLLALAGLPSAPASAQEIARPPETPALCTDRPTKSNFACTVPRGMVQIETDLFSFTRAEASGIRSDTWLYTNPTIKYGLTDRSDLEVNVAPLIDVRSSAPGIRTRQTSIGDLFIRYKHRLSDPSARVQVSLLPYVKVPLASRGIGNREWEGGIYVPVNISIAPVTLTFVPSIDILADALDPNGRHIQVTGLVNIGVPLSSRVTLYGELWTAQNFDPSGTVRQYSADIALAWLARPNLQLDVGANFGLNRFTPDVQAYVGLSARF